MRVVIFGTGMIYQCNQIWIPAEDIVSFIDNDTKKQGSYLNGIQINALKYIFNISYDKIVLMSTKQQEMKSQLLGMGISEDLIWTWKRYQFECLRGVLKLYCYHEEQNTSKERILIVSQHLTYDGAAMAAVHAVKALQLRKYQVALAAPSGNEAFIEEMSGRGGINIIICPAICYSDQTDMYWIKQFDAVLVNVFSMLPCAYEICKFKPVLWWLHEVKSDCATFRDAFSQYGDLSEMQHISIAAVSEIAKCNFEMYYPGRVNYIMPYGIPDEYAPVTNELTAEKFTFAIIGPICERKAQKIFIQAVLNFSKEELNNLEFLLIGACSTNEYCKEVKKLAEEVPQIKLTGQLTREEMKMVYQKIDVVVCASMEETMSIAITEGMMHGKVCITTDSTGIADYITNGENGFICRTGDTKSLWNSMKWVVEHRSQLHSIGEHARETYLKNFTMESFGERLEKLIAKTKKPLLN